MTGTATQSRAAEVAEKLERVRAHLDATGRSGVLLTRQFLVSWITAGMEDLILRGQDVGFVWALVTPDGAYLVTSNIEAARLGAEEGPEELGFEVVAVPWYEGHFQSALGELCDPSKLSNDGTGPGTDASDALQGLRLRLTAGELDRMRALGADACEALETTMGKLTPGMPGTDLSAVAAYELERRGIFPFAILAGGDARRASFRHPTVSSAPLERDVMVVFVGVRGGLNIACTRTASVGSPDPALAERHAIASEAEARAIEVTRPGATYGQALQAQIDVYEAHGYRDEWRNHTQGGPIGYGAREFGVAPLAAPDRFTEYAVEADHAVAWNPTVQGAKSEDTFIVGESENELITNSSTWPTIEVPLAEGSTTRPAILEVG
ncbi:MAG TPA: M24 family metallopeptidase [Thermoleophilaceae bacterium]|nr:M24 family metallopeptidase [Thermoleophilaceae bacterium]